MIILAIVLILVILIGLLRLLTAPEKPADPETVDPRIEPVELDPGERYWVKRGPAA